MKVIRSWAESLRHEAGRQVDHRTPAEVRSADRVHATIYAGLNENHMRFVR